MKTRWTLLASSLYLGLAEMLVELLRHEIDMEGVELATLL
jgi:hypothetical protein